MPRAHLSHFAFCIRISFITAVLLFILATHAMPESHSPLYVSGNLSVLTQGTATIKGESHNLDRGIGASFAVGRKFSLFRLEMEFVYNDANNKPVSIDSQTLAGIRLADLVEQRRLRLLNPRNVISASLASNDWQVTDTKEVDGYDLHVMVNVWYDIEPTPRFALHVGGGLGLAHVALSATYDATASFDLEVQKDGEVSTSRVDSRIYSAIYNEQVWALAYQAGVGMSYAISDRASVGVSYRLIGIGQDSPGIESQRVFVMLRHSL